MKREKAFLKKMRRSILYSDMITTMAKTTVLRVIRYFPKNGNQQDKKIVAYNKYGHIIAVFGYEGVQYLSVSAIQSLLPKRITLIEDEYYMTKKDFDSYLRYEQ